MKISIHGTCRGYAPFTPEPFDGLFDARADSGNISALGKDAEAYAVHFCVAGVVFSKYKIINDQTNRLGNVAVSVLVPNDKKLAGAEVKNLLDGVLKAFVEKYIEFDEFKRDGSGRYLSISAASDGTWPNEDWSYVTAAEELYRAKLQANKHGYGIKRGDGKAAFVYYPSDGTLIKCLDLPCQSVYARYRQIFFVSEAFRGKPENPLNSLQHSGSDVTNEIDLNPRHTVTFRDWDGPILKEESVIEGRLALAPPDPVREGYRFAGWDKAFAPVTGDVTLTATYEVIRHTVVFKDWDGAVLSEDAVVHGRPAAAPPEPKRAGYRFTGWDDVFAPVTRGLTVTAKYEFIPPPPPPPAPPMKVGSVSDDDPVMSHIRGERVMPLRPDAAPFSKQLAGGGGGFYAGGKITASGVEHGPPRGGRACDTADGDEQGPRDGKKGGSGVSIPTIIVVIIITAALSVLGTVFVMREAVPKAGRAAPAGVVREPAPELAADSGGFADADSGIVSDPEPAQSPVQPPPVQALPPPPPPKKAVVPPPKTGSSPRDAGNPVDFRNRQIHDGLIGGKLTLNTLKEYDTLTQDAVLKKSIRLALEFWELNGKPDSTYHDYQSRLQDEKGHVLSSGYLMVLVNSLVTNSIQQYPKKCSRPCGIRAQDLGKYTLIELRKELFK